MRKSEYQTFNVAPKRKINKEPYKVLDAPNLIDDYYENGFRNIFLRPISPYGFALKSPKKNKYITEKFLDFYKKGFMHILKMNKNGIYFSEDFLQIGADILEKCT